MSRKFDLKLPSTGRVFYYLTNGVVIFAEGEAVKKDGDGNYSFDVTQSVMCLFNTGADAKGRPNPPQFAPMTVFPGAPTFYVASRTDVRGISDCTDEAMLLQIRATRSGLTLGPGVMTKAPPMDSDKDLGA